MRTAMIAIAGAVLAGAVLAGCESNAVSRAVGARCDTSDDCDERCLSSGADYPGGFCTVSCSDRTDCPSDTTCADVEGGVCLFTCDNDIDCTFLGDNWGCMAVDLHGGGIKVNVCRG
ncbi:MAG TPA: hypothetical protein VH165_36800 [Kofleriaceae bacterium]|jgi:hypothetical protein|nr:hypothetical protein [Kofleriaceae bacterium]